MGKKRSDEGLDLARTVTPSALRNRILQFSRHWRSVPREAETHAIGAAPGRATGEGQKILDRAQGQYPSQARNSPQLIEGLGVR
jgi:hypothetical protein